MSLIFPRDADLHYPDGTHRWMCPDPAAGEDVWADRVRAHMVTHKGGCEQIRVRGPRITPTPKR
jgi:hypothetical protein